jgi:hypothetical protein
MTVNRSVTVKAGVEHAATTHVGQLAYVRKALGHAGVVG